MDRFEIKVSNIQWDTDDLHFSELALPTTATLRIIAESKADAEEMAINMLSDKYGFCIFNAEFKYQ